MAGADCSSLFVDFLDSEQLMIISVAREKAKRNVIRFIIGFFKLSCKDKVLFGHIFGIQDGPDRGNLDTVSIRKRQVSVQGCWLT